MCGIMVAGYYFKAHMARSHGICSPHTRGVNDVRRGLAIYIVFFPRVLQEAKCPVLGCPAVSHSVVRLCENFMDSHVISKVVVV